MTVVRAFASAMSRPARSGLVGMAALILLVAPVVVVSGIDDDPRGLVPISDVPGAGTTWLMQPEPGQVGNLASLALPVDGLRSITGIATAVTSSVPTSFA